MTSTDFFDQINTAIQSKRSFVLFSKPENQAIKAYIQTTTENHIINDYSESGFVFAPFDSKKDSYYIPLEDSSVIKLEQLEFEVFSETSPLHSMDSTGDHLNLVSKAIDEIKATDLEKVVLSREFKFNLEDSNPIEIFKKLAQNYSSAFTYCWFHPETGFWLGASPESLLKLEGKSVSTMALAGTQIFKSSEQVQWDSKNMEEHAFVTDYLLEVLSDYLEPIKTSGPHTLKAGELLHLQTLITGRLKPTYQSLKQLLRAMHPTPAVCGTPRNRALEFINSMESYDREYYAGFFGELNIPSKSTFRNSKRNIENRAYQTERKSTHLAVNLRCMQLKDTLAVLYSGGGITKDSDPLSEFTETENKIQTIKKVL
ncbi:isochorismate synthase [Formosa sp. Hel1_33_131]|uniref:chorismate-binding protein n=1 Tax=Formosa sp. Hel1_33_131 TaxID=1336794 RepID=UPI00084E199C|nr:chorismate-binding protein [Formosa sp. Hel1_33_131]AOR29502.1 isochorismate synthase [Formosa sp. Hel1_33_131]